MKDETVKRVVVWGTGNVGRPAIRAVASHRDLELAGVIVHRADKVGVDAGTLALVAELGLAATDDASIATAGDVDAVVYAVNADFRPIEALDEVEALLRAGVNVVSTSFYPMNHPPSMEPMLRARFDEACAIGNASMFGSGIDPGWAMDVLPLFLSGVSADITEIRAQEIFNYALYDQPDAVRELCGFGTPMDATPPMLLDFSLKMVWAAMVNVLADGLGVELEDVVTNVEKRPLDRTITVPGMGDFEAGTQGAFRFEVQGLVDGKPLLVIEHITRIDDDCAPDWPRAANGSSAHQVQITGRPNLTVAVHGHEPGEPGEAGGGNATAANRIVNAIPAVCDAAPGIIHPLDLPFITGSQQLRRR
jgi:2,4-diaminopentanoate dehydrogenase